MQIYTSLECAGVIRLELFKVVLTCIVRGINTKFDADSADLEA